MVTGSALSGQMAESLVPRDPRRTLTSLGVVVYDWDIASDRIVWGPNAAEVMGIPAAALWSTGAAFAAAVDGSDGPTRQDAVGFAETPDTGSGVGFAALYRLRLDGGRCLTVDDSGRWFSDQDGRPATVHGTMRLRPSVAQASGPHAERTGFLAQLAVDLVDSGEAKRPLTLFAISIANLSFLNDALGFDGADRVVETVLARLFVTSRARDRFVRYSGNRFALALRGCGHDEAKIAAERLKRLVTDDAIGTAHGAVRVQLAIGGATAPDHALEAGILLRRAEAALGLAKRRDGASFLLYDAKLFRSPAREPRRDPVLDSLDLLNGRRIALALQPVVDAKTRIPVFFEALLRAQREDGRVHPAGDVIPALEQAGLVHLADARMLELVADRLVADPAARISLNVSPLTAERPDWLPNLAVQLGSRPGIASRLIIEMTETAAIRDADAMRRTLETAKALGVSIAIDDFGAGHTSFRHLRNFPVDLVKIDGAFVHQLARSKDDQFFVRTLIDLAHHLGIASVAEWVEAEDSAALLAAWGVDFLQGDHCGRPELVETDLVSRRLVA